MTPEQRESLAPPMMSPEAWERQTKLGIGTLIMRGKDVEYPASAYTRIDLFNLRQLWEKAKERLVPEVEVPMTAAQQTEWDRLFEAGQRTMRGYGRRRLPREE